jgi:NADH:ubiquinone oxidoreductase subunit 4 (subunit M)
MENQLLSIITFLPLVAAVILALFMRGDDAAARQGAKWLALFTTSATFVISLFILFRFDPSDTGFQFVEEREWILGPDLQNGRRWHLDPVRDADNLPFAIKVPMWPFHTWLPDAHVEAPTAGSIILAGVLLKLGGYGFLRFSIPLLPDAAVTFAPIIIGLAIVAIVYGGLVAMVQPDMKKLVAYSSVSHMGFVMLGAFVFNEQGLQGAIYQMISHGITTGALFLLVGVIYEQTHDRQIAHMGGLNARVPGFAAMFGLFTFASIGLPGLSGFVGEFLRRDRRDPVGGLCALALPAGGLRRPDQGEPPLHRRHGPPREGAVRAADRGDADPRRLSQPCD